jgi:hypothetical protein
MTIYNLGRGKRADSLDEWSWLLAMSKAELRGLLDMITVSHAVCHKRDVHDALWNGG